MMIILSVSLMPVLVVVVFVDEDVGSADGDEDVGSAGGGGYVVRNSRVGNGDVVVLVTVKVKMVLTTTRYRSLLLAVIMAAAMA